MRARSHSIRFSEFEWTAVALEAQHAGVSVAQFVREAAVARAAFSYARRDGEGVELFDELHRLLRDRLPRYPDLDKPPEE